MAHKRSEEVMAHKRSSHDTRAHLMPAHTRQQFTLASAGVAVGSRQQLSLVSASLALACNLVRLRKQEKRQLASLSVS